MVAVCDVYEPRRWTPAEVCPGWARVSGLSRTAGAEGYRRRDHRRSDHWHVPMARDAVRAGKDVYVEKPLSHTIEEAQALVKVVADSRQILQVGLPAEELGPFPAGARHHRGGQARNHLDDPHVVVSELHPDDERPRPSTRTKSIGSASWDRHRTSRSMPTGIAGGGGTGISAAAT